MNYRAVIKNILIAILSQAVALCVSLAMSLLVPKILGVTEYGFWQLFLFYTSYAGLLSLGATDGLYLIIGGTERSAVDKCDVVSQVLLSTVMVAVLSIIVAILFFFFVDDYSRRAVIVFSAAYAVMSHIVASLGFIFQAMNETKRYSCSVVIDKLSFLLPMLVLIVLKVGFFEPYCVAYIASKFMALFYCAYELKDFISTGFNQIRIAIHNLCDSIKVGCKLMLANVSDMLVLGVVRALIDVTWGIETFGKVSFSLSMVNFFILFISQASMVLFPALRQGSEGERRIFYSGVRDAMEVVLPGVYLLYYPMAAILPLWLPQYGESMVYFALLLPVCVFNTKMDICCTTYFKVLREESLLLCINLVTVFASALLSVVGAYLAGSLELMLIGAVSCIVARSLWCERYLNKKLGVPGSAIQIEEIALTVVFIVSMLVLPAEVATVVYAGAFAMYLVLNRSVVRSFILNIRKALRNS